MLVRDVEIPIRFQKSLSLLLQAVEHARGLDRDVWDFAVELHCLREFGLTNSDLRWLHYRKYVEHGVELTAQFDEQRTFAHGGLIKVNDPRACLVLTELGEAIARQLCFDEISSACHVPTWDDVRHELWLGDSLVKQFRLPSPNQEKVLTAFQEEAWPLRIDDPLPPNPNIDPKRRLGDTIKSLNRRQRNHLIRFMGDGTGAGVRWEVLAL